MSGGTVPLRPIREREREREREGYHKPRDVSSVQVSSSCAVQHFPDTVGASLEPSACLQQCSYLIQPYLLLSAVVSIAPVLSYAYVRQRRRERDITPCVYPWSRQASVLLSALCLPRSFWPPTANAITHSSSGIMVREIITLQVGQCGNQIGRAFWKQALAEHASVNVNGVFDDCMSTFFRNVDSRTNRDVAIGDGRQPIYDLKARAILIDMETGPVSQTSRGELGDLFDERQFVTGVSGAGNNWAHGNAVYGPEYHDELLEAVRRSAEMCNSLQSFFLVHSLGGGTGSGLGTYLLSLLEDNFPDVYRFSTVVFPSEDDDVITSPYNSVLALKELTEHAHCVLPVDNASLSSIVASWDSGRDRRSGGTETGFDRMNSLVARLLTDLTASMRFAGDLNVDLNEITTNLVPFPRLHYLLSSLSPMPTLQSTERSEDHPPATTGIDARPRRMAQMFSGAFSTSNMLMRANPRRSKFLACGLLVRGEVVVSDVNANIERLTAELDMVHWNPEGYKIGLCSVPPVGATQSLLCLSNNCCITGTFADLRGRFMQLYQREAMLHHYTKFMDRGGFDEALESLDSLITDYAELEQASEPHNLGDSYAKLAF